MRKFSVILFAMLLAGFAAAPAHAQKTLDPDVQSLVQGNTDFGLTLYQQLAAKEGNLFLSPYSISNAFGMCYAGARANTAAEMKTTLRYNVADDRLHPAFGKLITQLQAKKGGDFQLAVANRLWGQKNYGFLPAFLKTGKDHYQAGLEEVDFVKNADGARKTINTWVEKQTNDKIKDLIPAGVLNADSRLVLTNAIYFKAPWAIPFSEKQTKPAPFELAGGKKVDVPMMQTFQSALFASHDAFSIVELPYSKGQQGMIVILPKKKDGLADVEKMLTAQNLAEWTKKMSTHHVDLKLPKFKITAEFKLNDVLKSMGMKDAFEFRKANFTGMATGEDLYITAVMHKAFVDVNEKGTEAAAATAIAIGTLSAPPPATFHADHPFVFLIRDRGTGTILFVGRVANPASN